MNPDLQADLSNPMSIAIPIREGDQTVNAYYAPWMNSEAVASGDFIGDVSKGGPVNYRNVQFNPHGNGTHTECVGHISAERESVIECLQNFWFLAKVVSVLPIKQDDGDRVIELQQMEELVESDESEALVIRTLPNDDIKLRTNYSGANAPYLAADAVQYLVDCGVEHLVLDLPSVDKEEDGGVLAAHRTFWQYPESTRMGSTITELAYIPDSIADGLYFLNLMVAPIDQDAAPSWPVLYAIT
jgi:kynurenine formamidase